MRETALRATHESLGARLVPFAGWTMPVQYSTVLGEVDAVRKRAGMFDIGHMGRVRIAGAGADDFLQKLQTNDVSAIPPGGIRYAMILDEQGLTQDDILVYREPDGDGFFMVINASNSEKDLEIMRATAAGFDVEITDQTDQLGMFAIQGPVAQTVAQSLTDIDLAAIKYYRWARGTVGGIEAGISRTGYTGEDGFELYVEQSKTAELWNTFLEAGKEHGVEPAGLASRDILRLEAGMCLYGHEINPTTTPLDAGLTWAVKYTHDFVGREALEKIKAEGGPKRKLVGLTTPSKRVPRDGYAIYDGDEEIGVVCSGASSPTVGTNIATAYVPADRAETGREVQFAIRDKREPAVIADLPFYKRAK